MNLRVSKYIAEHKRWQNQLKIIRAILLSLSLEEDIKWGMPAYIHQQKNILSVSAFKNYCGIWFHQGCFLRDEAKLLINAQKGKTKAMRQMRFTETNPVNVELVTSYVLETIINSEAGLELKPKRNTNPMIIPEELKIKFSTNKKLENCFNEFTLSKQREFCEYISSAKKESTKEKRLIKILPMILNNLGLNDKYRN